MKQAEQLANKLTLRSKPGQEANASPAVRAIEAIGTAVSNASTSPGSGAMVKAFAPFMRVSTNFVARQIEYSPLNLIDKPSNLTADRFGTAIAGSMVTLGGAMLASQGRVYLAAPKDKASSDAFYASGARPYSVKIGDHFVPLELLGPFALSLMMPAAVMQAQSGANANKNDTEKLIGAITNVTRYAIASTPLTSISQLLSVLNGDTQVNLGKILGGVASQVVPLEALQRYVAQALDPVYRKTTDPSLLKSAEQQIQSGIPGMTKSLTPYTLPDGTPEARNLSNFVSPYPIGNVNPTYGPLYDAKLQAGQDNAQAIALLAKGDEAGARAEIAKLPADQQAAAFTKAAEAAGKINPTSGSQAVAFYSNYKAVRAQSDKVSKQVTALIKNGQFNQAAQTAYQYNQTIPSQFSSYTQKYGQPNGESAKMIKSLQVSHTPASMKTRAKTKAPISFGQ